MEEKFYYKIERIRRAPQGRTFVIRSSQGTTFEMLVSEEQFERFDLYEGEMIDDEHFLTIREEMLFDNARRQAFAILSYGENNKKMLIDKLVKRGFSPKLSSNVAIYMEHRGYIDEKKQMDMLCDQYFKKKFGRIKIVEELMIKGFKREDVSEFLKEKLKDVDFSESCAFIIENKFSPLPKEPDEIKKMMTTLMRYGYSVNDIKAGIRRITEGDKNGD